MPTAPTLRKHLANQHIVGFVGVGVVGTAADTMSPEGQVVLGTTANDRSVAYLKCRRNVRTLTPRMRAAARLSP